MSDNHQVNIDDLLKLSEGLVSNFFPAHDIYSLLVLSLVTVTRYSSKKHHLTPETRIDLSVAFLGDLIQHLVTKEIISMHMGQELLRDSIHKKEELPKILRSYIYVSAGLRTKIKDNDESSGCLNFKKR